MIRDALDCPLNIPSKELPPHTELRRAPLLEAQAEIAVAAGDVERARWAASELESIAKVFDSKAIHASASIARGRVQRADGDDAAARASFDRAFRLWSEIGAVYEAASARELMAAGAVPAASPASEFLREGDYWTITFAGRTARVRDLVGLRYLGRLLAEPGREFHVLDLTGAPSEGDAGGLLDERARAEYKRRLADIEEDLEEARAFGDAERAGRAGAEKEFLLKELSRAVGLGGRTRTAGSASERARASVTQAVRHAMARIAEHHAALGEHLSRAIRTGTYCAYLPDTRVDVSWKV
jgi:hypothetical protein